MEAPLCCKMPFTVLFPTVHCCTTSGIQRHNEALVCPVSPLQGPQEPARKHLVKPKNAVFIAKTPFPFVLIFHAYLEDGILANVQSSAQCVGDNIGVIAGTEGNIIIDNINNPQTITVNGPDRTFVETIQVPRQITGYEYQFLACRQALLDGLTEPREMPHAETLYIMQLMDGLRRKWGVSYPMDEE